MIEVGHRKERSDKKREVKPLIPVETKDAIYRISHVTHKPIKDVCEFLVCYVAKDKQTIDRFSVHFKRNIQIDRTLYLGDLNVVTVSKRLKVNSDQVSIKFKRDDYETISSLAYALDVTPTRATAILLEYAAANIKAVNEFVREYLIEELSEGQLSELRQVLSYVNMKNHYEKSTWLSLLSVIVGEVRPAARKLRELVEEFLYKK